MKIESKHEPVSGHRDVPVRMVREDLNAIPAFELPDGYTIRWYEPGDDAHWLRIHRECESYGGLKPDLFQDQFGRDESVLAQRVAFVCGADSRPVSTNTAWMNDWNGKEWGRVHWVATSRDEQGKRLSKPLMTAVCERMRELGHDCAYLTTNTLRIRAISLYAAFGFEPYWETDKEKAAWEDVEEKLREIGRTVEMGRG